MSEPAGPSSKLYGRYPGNANHAEAAETWSSSKIFAASGGGSESCTHLEGLASCTKGKGCCNLSLTLSLSLTQTLSLTLTQREHQGKHGATPLGDLVSVITSYDETAGYTSNSLANYFGGSVMAGRGSTARPRP